MWQSMFTRFGLGLKVRAPKSPARARFRPSVEGLEEREVLSASPLAAPALAPALTAALTQETQSLIPIRVTNIEVRDGALFAVGTIGGQAFETKITLELSENQPEDAECPILDLKIEEIHLNLLGLRVDTSDICLTITALEGEGLLGDLLCDVAHLLDGGLSLDDLLGTGADALSTGQVLDLTNGLEDVLNEVFGSLTDVSSDSDTELSAVAGRGRATDILTLSLGPVDLTILGLNVHLDDCEGGPVTVDISAERGPGNLLGNLISGLAGALDRGPLSRIDRLIDRIADEVRDLLGQSPVGQVIPLEITNVTIRDGQLFGTVRLGDTTVEVPLELSLAETGEEAAEAGRECPILRLELGPIDLDLLGLGVETSAICVDITAEEGEGNLLGNLLCDVAHLLDDGVPLADALNGLTATEAVRLTNGLDDILNGVFSELTDAAAVTGATTDILNLELGPINLDLLGLKVAVDNCEGGPVTLDVTATAGSGNLLGNLLTGLAGLLDSGAGANAVNRLLSQIAGILRGLI